jgi:hypothetical protein
MMMGLLVSFPQRIGGIVRDPDLFGLSSTEYSVHESMTPFTRLVRLLELGPDTSSKSLRAGSKSGFELLLPSCLSVSVNDSIVLIWFLSTNAWNACAVLADMAIRRMVSIVRWFQFAVGKFERRQVFLRGPPPRSKNIESQGFQITISFICTSLSDSIVVGLRAVVLSQLAMQVAAACLV